MFKYSDYAGFLRLLKRLGRIVPFRDWDQKSIVFLMRHDFDVDVSLAFRLAAIDEENGVRSTYFFLMTCDTYNPLSPRNRRFLTQLTERGFEVGLHFDPTVYGDVSEEALGDRVREEAELLSRISGQDVRSVSLHNPSVHGRYPTFGGFVNAYDPRVFDDTCYISDSLMNFRDKDPRKFVERVADRTVQILTHPMHYSEDGSGYPDIMSRHINRYIELVNNNFMVNATYRRQVEAGLLQEFLKSCARPDDAA